MIKKDETISKKGKKTSMSQKKKNLQGGNGIKVWKGFKKSISKAKKGKACLKQTILFF